MLCPFRFIGFVIRLQHVVAVADTEYYVEELMAGPVSADLASQREAKQHYYLMTSS